MAGFSFKQEDILQRLVNLDLQQKNKFKLLIIDNFSQSLITGLTGGSLTSPSLGSGGVFKSLEVTTLYLQSISVPSPVTIEYEESETKYAKSLKRPDPITMTFLEDEKGTVWKYLQTWRKQIVQAVPVGGLGAFVASSLGQGGSGANVKYMFNDNQLIHRKTGILLLGYGDDRERTRSITAHTPGGSLKLSHKAQANKKLYKYPRIMLYGLTYASNSEIELSRSEEGNLLYTANFDVFEVGAPTSLF